MGWFSYSSNLRNAREKRECRIMLNSEPDVQECPSLPQGKLATKNIPASGRQGSNAAGYIIKTPATEAGV
jgi:hypothetical protein